MVPRLVVAIVLAVGIWLSSKGAAGTPEVDRVLTNGVEVNGSASAVGSALPNTGSRAAAADSEEYAYRSPRFTEFVAESYRYRRAGDPDVYFIGMEESYARLPFPGSGPGLEEWLRSKRGELSALSGRDRAEAEKELGRWLHQWVKRSIPHYSLNQGYEFSYVARYRGRQCFLQSILIASLLQSLGVDAGVAMVYRNTEGEEVNNSHAVTLVKLSNGRDIIVDGSHRQPFVFQQGLLVRLPAYRYVDPIYDRYSAEIRAYRPAGGKEEISPGQVRPLDLSFLRSQFWYYRGERAKGGLLADTQTKAGIEESARCLRTSLQWCPGNPLSVYMLGRAYLAQGDTLEARETFNRAESLYAKYGWVPPGLQEALRMVARQKS